MNFKVECINPSNADNITPALVVQQAQEVIATHKHEFAITILGKITQNGVVPMIGNSKMSAEQLLYLKHCLDVHIRSRIDAALEIAIKGQQI